MNTGYLRRLKGASDPDCASTGQSWRSARPVRPVTLSPWQVLEGAQCGWRREGWRAGHSLQETLVVAAGAAGCWVRPGVCLGCGPHAGRPGRGLRASWGAGRTRVWAVSRGITLPGRGAVRGVSGGASGPQRCYQGQMRRWCIRGPDLLRCSVLPDCQGLSGRPDVDTRGGRPSKRGLVGEIKSHPVSGRRRARQGHLGPGTRDDVVGRSTQHFACYILFDVLILLLPLTKVGAISGF